jgi:hypothetical protein
MVGTIVKASIMQLDDTLVRSSFEVDSPQPVWIRRHLRCEKELVGGRVDCGWRGARLVGTKERGAKIRRDRSRTKQEPVVAMSKLISLGVTNGYQSRGARRAVRGPNSSDLRVGGVGRAGVKRPDICSIGFWSSTGRLVTLVVNDIHSGGRSDEVVNYSAS